MPQVRAKFQCFEVKQVHSVSYVVLYAVTDGSQENKSFWDATPNGRIELGVQNEAATKHFKVGEEYYVDFTPANDKHE